MKSLLGPCTDLQLEPFQYPIFWDITRAMRDNTWTPEEVGVSDDLATFNRLRSSEDKYDQSKLHWFKALWGQLTAFDLLRSEDAITLSLLIFKPEEVKHFLCRMQWDERLHTESYRYIVQNFGLPESGPDSIYEMWSHVPEMKARVEYAERINEELAERVFSTGGRDPASWSLQGKQTILRSLIFWFLIFEKVWFLINLKGPISYMALPRAGANKPEFIGAAEQLWYIARDEEQHIRGGVELIRNFVLEHPETITEGFLYNTQKMFEDCLDLEAKFVNHCTKVAPIVGYSTLDHVETAKVFANLGARATGFLPEPFPGAKHRFPWMAEASEHKKETNFFEQTPKDYRKGVDLGLDKVGGGMPTSVMETQDA